MKKIPKFTWHPLMGEEIKWLLVDFDETIANNNGFPNYLPQEPLVGAVTTLKKIEKMGYKITIFTARPWVDYKNIEKYCKHYGINARRIICGKPLGKCLIDDRAIGFKNWKQTLKEFKEFKK